MRNVQLIATSFKWWRWSRDKLVTTIAAAQKWGWHWKAGGPSYSSSEKLIILHSIWTQIEFVFRLFSGNIHLRRSENVNLVPFESRRQEALKLCLRYERHQSSSCCTNPAAETDRRKKKERWGIMDEHLIIVQITQLLVSLAVSWSIMLTTPCHAFRRQQARAPFAEAPGQESLRPPWTFFNFLITRAHTCQQARGGVTQIVSLRWPPPELLLPLTPRLRPSANAFPLRAP